MSVTNLEANCPHCGAEALEARVSGCTYDAATLDIIVECMVDEGGCGRVLNAFVPFAEMMELEA